VCDLHGCAAAPEGGEGYKEFSPEKGGLARGQGKKRGESSITFLNKGGEPAPALCLENKNLRSPAKDLS